MSGDKAIPQFSFPFLFFCAGLVVLTSILTRSHWFPLVGCGVPVGLNDGSMKPSLAYV